MAIRKDDNRTLALDLPGGKGRRGRYATGAAKSGAQRQADRRARLAGQGVGVLTVHIAQDVLDALTKHVQFKDVTKDSVVERLLRNQLLRKR